MKRVLVCGGRDYGRLDLDKVLDHPRRRAERKRLCEVLGKLAVEIGTFQLISGGAKGADALAEAWVADSRGFPKPMLFPAKWDDVSHPMAVIKINKKGKPYDVTAGLRRNQQMVDDGHPDLVIAFPGGTGTADMVTRARKALIEVREIK